MAFAAHHIALERWKWKSLRADFLLFDDCIRVQHPMTVFWVYDHTEALTFPKANRFLRYEWMFYKENRHDIFKQPAPFVFQRIKRLLQRGCIDTIHDQLCTTTHTTPRMTKKEFFDLSSTKCIMNDGYPQSILATHYLLTAFPDFSIVFFFEYVFLSADDHFAN
jgi:hypothetical protein